MSVKTQKETKTVTIGLISDEKRKEMKGVLERLMRVKTKEQKELDSSEGYYTNYLLKFNIEALKLLSTEKSDKEKSFEATLLVIAGLTAIIADKKVMGGLTLFKQAFDSIDIKKSWFAIALGIKGLEFTGGKKDKEVTKRLIEQVGETLKKKNEEGTYQCLLTLSRVALLGETREIRDMGGRALESVKNCNKPELLQGYFRHLSKMANHGKSEEERGQARQWLLSLKAEGKYGERKKEGVKEGSEKQKATARKMESFRRFDSEAEKILRPQMIQTPVKGGGSGSSNAANTSPQGSPPPSTTPMGKPTTLKYRVAKPEESLFARVLGSSWDNFWKLWLKFEGECLEGGEVDVNALTILGNNTSMMKWTPKSFEVAAKFLNEDTNKTYKKFDLSFSTYVVNELADFLPQVDNRNEIEFVLKGEEEYCLLSKALVVKGLYQIAKSLLEKAAEKNPSFMESCDFLVRLGLVYNEIEAPNDTKTESIYKKSLSKDPNHFVTLYYYSFFLLKSNRWDECFDVLRKCVKLRPDHADSQYTLAKNLTKLYELQKKDRSLIEEAKKHIDAVFESRGNEKNVLILKSVINNLLEL
jgi:tetratricopeptide (TPR) repeat protein